MDKRSHIIELEKRLLEAFSNKDVNVVDELLHDDAIFVYPNGQMVTKQNVLDNYRSGNSAFTTIVATDQVINIIDSTAVVSMNLQLRGKYYDQEISSQFKYIRVWKECSGGWKAIAVSGVPIKTDTN